MAKAVFTTKVSPSYDDLPERRYHFPRTYLNQVQQALGDWIVYYEPRRSTGDVMSSGGRMAYFATARLAEIVPDPVKSDHFYALIDTATYLDFVDPVSFADGDFYYESSLRKPDGSTNKGAFGRAVRVISDREYDTIWRAGFGGLIGLKQAVEAAPAPETEVPIARVADSRASFEFETDREVIEQLVSRPFRDRAFATAVKDAYGHTCAVTGLKIINGGGRSEVQAAHIRPVHDRGPDSVRNGIALCGTVHWMFDRGLLAIDENFSILSAHDRLPDTVQRLLPSNNRLLVPEREDLRPHPQFLAYHRDHIFKG